jgi:hypothetical protein
MSSLQLKKKEIIIPEKLEVKNGLLRLDVLFIFFFFL